MNYYDILLAKKLSGGGGGDITTEALNVTANGQYTAPQGKAYTPVNVNVAGYKVGEVETPTPIATFNGTSNPLKSLTASIVPVQDLHGYDSPWAGGAGKNKFDYLQLTNASGWTNTSGTYSGNIYNLYAYAGSGFPTQPTYKANTAYTLSMKVVDTDGTSRFVIEYTDSTTDYVVISSVSIGNYVTVTSNASKTISKIYFTYNNSGNLSIREIMLEEGTSRTAWTPYSNICPISGHTEANVTVADLNTMSVVDNWLTTINVAHSISKDTITIDYLNLVPYNNPCVLFDNDRTVTLSVELITGVATGVKIQLIDKNNTLVGQINNTSKTFTGIGSKIRLDYGNGGKAIIKGLKIYGNGTTTTIPFTDSQGQSVEVFGGSVDVVNGVVTPCPYYESYNGEQLTGEWISDRDVYTPNTSPTIGAQVVNIGATDTSFSTQPTSIKSLDGENNVSASTGDVEELKYFEEL